jgi:anti-anti-sigma factor
MCEDVESAPVAVVANRSGDATLLTVRGELDYWTSAQLRDELEGLLWEGGNRFVVNVSGVSFIDSGGAQPLVDATRAARYRGGGLLVVGARPKFRWAVEMMGLDSEFSFDD